jgi:lysozyme family protein
MGITHRTLASWRGHTVTKGDVARLTKNEAKEIYRANYWTPVRGDDLPYGLDLVAFDGAVNSGVSRGAKWVQRALGVAQDGHIGPDTLRVAGQANVENIINRAATYRLDFLRGLKTWDAFGRGWQSRVDGVRAEALDMAKIAEKPAKEPANRIDWGAIIKAIMAIFRGGKS